MKIYKACGIRQLCVNLNALTIHLDNDLRATFALAPMFKVCMYRYKMNVDIKFVRCRWISVVWSRYLSLTQYGRHGTRSMIAYDVEESTRPAKSNSHLLVVL